MRRRFLIVLALLTVVGVAAILTDALPWLRGPAPDSAVWHWPYRPRPWHAWWPALGAAALWLAVFSGWVRRGVPDRLALAGLALATFALQWGLLYADRPNAPAAELIDRTLSVQSHGYFRTAADLDDLHATLRDYPAAMRRFESEHARTHPPGLVLFSALTIAALDRTPTLAQALAAQVWPLRCTDLWLLDSRPAIAAALGVQAWLPVVIAAAIVWPAWWVARLLLPRPADGRPVVIAALLPALLLFAPLPDQLFAVLTLLVAGSFGRGLARDRGGWFLLAGGLVGLGSFLSLGNGALAALCGAWGVLWWWQEGATRPLLRRLTGHAALFALGAALIWLVYAIGWGVSPVAIAQAGLEAHYELVTTKRSYRVWLGFNLLDATLFAGVPLVALWLAGVPGALRRVWRREGAISADSLTLATALLLLALTLSGSTRGEVGRIWLFAMPLLAVGAARQWQAGRAGHGALSGWIGLQLLWVLAIGLAWRPVGATIVVAQRPEMVPLPISAEIVDQPIGPHITLHGRDVTESADGLHVTLFWQTERPALRPWTVFNHLVNEAGELVAQQDGWSGIGRWPPTCWRRGELISDPHTVRLPDSLPPGDYRLYTGLYDAATGERLRTPDGRDAILLMTLTR
jgi:hypothetical protein